MLSLLPLCRTHDDRKSWRKHRLANRRTNKTTEQRTPPPSHQSAPSSPPKVFYMLPFLLKQALALHAAATSRTTPLRAQRPALPRAAWVLIFNQGSQTTDGGRDASAARQQQGLYCLWSRGVNSAVAFEERDGALRYAFKLKARGLGVPSPTLMTMAVREERMEV